MTKRQIMVRAHELARTMVGDYTARMILALRQAWKEARANSTTTVTRMTKSGMEYTATFGWVKETRVLWADGDKIESSKDVFVLDVTTANFGKVDDAWIGNSGEHGTIISGTVTHNGKRGKLVLRIDEATYDEILSAKEARTKRVQVERRGPGYCHRCDSYCYGDCMAS